ncbi:MAG TPA: DegT/DnrJ/EryC1/StrS family aminotransferase [Hyphomonadaceae bacterium]|jgi:dTDP-4-amino-4,6-dideoxygalactose transaminase|nr:DegT/DnrJ/EryC1/StrS family aminotransferase [Hyphomonadaceae bacterium]
MPLKVYPRLEIDIGWDDLSFALAGKAPPPEVSEHAIHNAFPNHPCIAALSVRTAFLALLQALKPPRGAEIIMSAVNIENMADIVLANGLVPVAADIDLETLAPSPEAVRGLITDRTILYLHAHLYGSRTSLEPVSNICRARNVLLVEDCAQAYDGATWHGSSEADISLFSFGPIKPATALGGAVMRVRAPELYAKVRAELANWPLQDNAAVSRRARKMMAFKLLSRPHLYALLLGVLRMSGKDAEKIIGSAARGFAPGDLIEQIMKRPSPRLLALMARRLSSPPDSAWRRGAAARLRNALRTDVFTPGSKADAHAYWFYPILVENPLEVIKRLRSAGFDATRGATSMRAIGEAPNATRLIENVVYLPLSPRMPDRQIDRMAGVVNGIANATWARAA